jgi:hypothetical protein
MSARLCSILAHTCIAYQPPPRPTSISSASPRRSAPQASGLRATPTLGFPNAPVTCAQPLLSVATQVLGVSNPQALGHISPWTLAHTPHPHQTRAVNWHEGPLGNQWSLQSPSGTDLRAVCRGAFHLAHVGAQSLVRGGERGNRYPPLLLFCVKLTLP